jgi:signal transduction histidine kinase
MVTTQRIPSIHRKLNNLFLRFSSLIFIVGCSIVVLLVINYSKNETMEKAMQWADVISHQSIKGLLENDRQHLNDNLQVLTSVNDLNYIYVYRIIDQKDKQINTQTAETSAKTPKVELFSLYKRGSSFYNSPTTFEQINALLSIKFYSDYFEFTYPIKNEQQLIGYLYVQFSREASNKKIIRLSVFIFIIAIMVLLIAYIVVTRLHQRIIDSISLLSSNIQRISQDKNFTMRCDKMSYQETDALAQNINILLAKAERYIAKRAEAEQQFIQLNKSLEDKVHQRTDALKESNQELLSTLETLHQYQGQLVESEKMASLGDMVAGVAHEVNTPVGLGVTSSSLLFDRLSDIKQAFENKTLKSSQLKKFLNDGEENLDIIMRNLKRAADLITSFKQVAVDQSSSEERRFNFKGLLNEVILTLQPQLKNTLYKVELNCPDDLIISSKPGPINQIIVNLIINSLLHGFDERDHGTITISVMNLSNQLHINYQDDGIGINQEIKNKIFDPFITTKRGSGGSGLGMHLVYNLITQALNGTISFESEPNQGVIFDINFPINN